MANIPFWPLTKQAFFNPTQLCSAVLWKPKSYACPLSIPPPVAQQVGSMGRKFFWWSLLNNGYGKKRDLGQQEGREQKKEFLTILTMKERSRIPSGWRRYSQRKVITLLWPPTWVGKKSPRSLSGFFLWNRTLLQQSPIQCGWKGQKIPQHLFPWAFRE